MNQSIKKFFFFFFTLFILFTQISCKKERDEQYIPSTKRTLIVYLAGDNSLSALLKKELKGYVDGWQNVGTNVVVYMDPSDGPPRLMLIHDKTHTGSASIDTLVRYPEESSATAATFGRVIEECTKRFPASSYGLIFSSHASGWLPKHTLSYPNFTSSIGSDSGNGTKPSTSSDEIDLTEFAEAIKDNQFDFIVFNACFMTGIEVAYELRNKTKYILGSSAEILGEGFEPALKGSFNILLNPDLAIPTALQNFGNAYYSYVMTQSGANQSTTLSVLDTKPLNLFASLFKNILPLNVTIENTTGLQQFDRPGAYGENILKPRFFDLQQVIEQRTTPNMYTSFNAIINQIVLWKAATPWMFIGYSGFPVNRHCGITTYLKQIEFTNMNESYSSLAWYKDTR